MNPGEYLPAEGDIAANLGRETRTLSVANLGDRPIQVGSHYHFFETNPALDFEREAAKGFRLNIPSGNAVRFEPGERKTVELVAFGGAQILQGFRNETHARRRLPRKPPTKPRSPSRARNIWPLTAQRRATKSAWATPDYLPPSSKIYSRKAMNANSAAANRCATAWRNRPRPAAAMKTCSILPSPMW